MADRIHVSVVPYAMAPRSVSAGSPNAALIVAIERVVVGHVGFDRRSSVSEVARTSAA
jgi:hypothetical protein